MGSLASLAATTDCAEKVHPSATQPQIPVKAGFQRLVCTTKAPEKAQSFTKKQPRAVFSTIWVGLVWGSLLGLCAYEHMFFNENRLRESTAICMVTSGLTHCSAQRNVGSLFPTAK